MHVTNTVCHIHLDIEIVELCQRFDRKSCNKHPAGVVTCRRKGRACCQPANEVVLTIDKASRTEGTVDFVKSCRNRGWLVHEPDNELKSGYTSHARSAIMKPYPPLGTVGLETCVFVVDRVTDRRTIRMGPLHATDQ